MSVIIAGIHTGIGKTICSAVICQALGYDYFKPVQAGDLDNSDSIAIKNLVSNPHCVIHPESYRLQIPASPHYAAEREGITIEKEKIILPQTQNNLLVETAGGVMSPLATNFLNLDLIEHLALPVILVSNNYLGSINHSLLSFLALQSRNIDIRGIVFSGKKNSASESFILEHTQLPLLFSIPQFEDLNSQTIARFAQTISIDI
ncbi:MAG: dethiobiotin synthase [Chitinophagales bacterium]|nr:dethiobiotin synthase [Chitinophagales bacterium]